MTTGILPRIAVCRERLRLMNQALRAERLSHRAMLRGMAADITITRMGINLHRAAKLKGRAHILAVDAAFLDRI